MSRLFVVVGYPDNKPTSEPYSVYVGSSGGGMRQAMATSTAQRFVVLANPLGIRKNNPAAEANRAAVAAKTPPPSAPVPVAAKPPPKK